MNGNEDIYRIFDEMAYELRMMAAERNAAVSDIVREALNEFMRFKNAGLNYNEIIRAVEKNMSEPERYFVSVSQDGYAVSVKSPLRYTRRPELKYEARIKHTGAVSECKISASLRSIDVDTLRVFSVFTDMWIELETRYLTGCGRIAYISDAGYFARSSRIPDGVRSAGSESAGAAISDYIRAFDEMFKSLWRPGGAQSVEKTYADYIKSGKLRI